MSYELREEQGFIVGGISVRASNASPERIGDLWRRFHSLGNAQCIPGRRDDAVYCVYCEYEGDFTQPYTVAIGCAVNEDAPLGEGMRMVRVDAGRFAVLQPTGEMPQAVFDAWSEVWTTPLDRRYVADFDRYGADGVVTVHVGVR